MTLSIIIPAYNAEKHIIRCLDSIKAQTMTDFECIVVNDGSTDSTAKICEAYSVLDSRFKCITIPNSGPARARNVALMIASGEWISFCDADDYMQPEKYEKMINVAVENNASVVQCGINVHNENDEIIAKWQLGYPGDYPLFKVEDKKILSHSKYDIGHCWDKIYKADLLEDIQFPVDIKMCEDTLFNIKVFLKAGSIYSLQEYLHDYVVYPESLAHRSMSATELTEFRMKVGSSLKSLESIESYFLYKSIITKFFNQVFIRYDAIDYVFPYVDCSKPVWQAEYKKATGTYIIDKERFTGVEDMLRYKLRGIEKYAPWIRKIFILVSDKTQIPDFINTKKVVVVEHKEFIPERFLPTFNSCTIEMFLHKIPNLSEKFIYSNDDFYITNIIKPQFFFVDDKIKCDLLNRKLWHKDDINKVWARIPQNTIALAAKDAYQYYTKYYDGVNLWEPPHVDKPMLKSNIEHVWSLYKNEIESSITMMRADKNLNQYLFIEYMMFHDKAVWASYRHKYYQIGNDTKKIIEAVTSDDPPREVCCNESCKSTMKDYELIDAAFRKKFPKKSSFEI